MASFELNNYITKRYERWLDYARYHCGRLGMAGEATDVLNEVLCCLLQKEEGQLSGMLRCHKGGYTALDWFVLRMLKTNIVSESSPYRQKRICRNVDRGVDVYTLNIKEDEVGYEEDPSEKIFKQMAAVREAVEHLGLSPKAKQIFHYRFFCGDSFADWKGSEGKKKLYDTYNKVMELVKQELKGSI